MPVLHIVGVDPGLVHTGCVRILIAKEGREIRTAHHLVDGIDGSEVSRWAHLMGPTPDIFIEKYTPRMHFATDERMVKGEAELKRAMPTAALLPNTGVKSIVTPAILHVLGLDAFSTVSHHQDLRSAARIAILGMMKDDTLNRALADIVMDHLDGEPWPVKEIGAVHAG